VLELVLQCSGPVPVGRRWSVEVVWWAADEERAEEEDDDDGQGEGLLPEGQGAAVEILCRPA
jgi:hypothetical protein